MQSVRSILSANDQYLTLQEHSDAHGFGTLQAPRAEEEIQPAPPDGTGRRRCGAKFAARTDASGADETSTGQRLRSSEPAAHHRVDDCYRVLLQVYQHQRSGPRSRQRPGPTRAGSSTAQAAGYCGPENGFARHRMPAAGELLPFAVPRRQGTMNGQVSYVRRGPAGRSEGGRRWGCSADRSSGAARRRRSATCRRSRQ